ncbi:MAG TPA: alpha/beta fold hydrolase [Candidatus Limnocylindrales bacterium]|nr:alpha/beta fold hydrolase [Candidatus Limnocylindrales bacterium]
MSSQTPPAADAGTPGPLADGDPELPIAVAVALATPAPGRERTVSVDGVAWRALEWGDPSDPPLLLVHGVTSNAETFWRIGPAVAAAGRHVLAVDLPGHGRTGAWRGRHRFAETAADVAGFIRAAGIERAGLAVLGHSWGGMVVAALPAAGLRPGRLILLDPPALPLAALEAMTRDPLERPYDSLESAIDVVRAANPGWSDGDVRAKALGLTQFDPTAVLAILLENGDWDGGLGALADPAARGIAVWLIRGEPEQGGMIPDSALPACIARIGRGRVVTIDGAPHSPQRTHPAATVAAVLQALA